MVEGIAIRFDAGGERPNPGLYEDVQKDGKVVDFGAWVKKGKYWFLVLGPKHDHAVEAFELLGRYLKPMSRSDYQHWHQQLRELHQKVEAKAVRFDLMKEGKG